MAIFSDLELGSSRLSALIGADAEASAVPRLMLSLGADAVVDVIAQTTAMIRMLESLRTAATGMIATLSAPALGHSGFAQTHGHRTPAALVQELTGATRSDAIKAVRVGESLLAEARGGDGGGAAGDVSGGSDPAGDDADERMPVAQRPWHALADDAVLDGRITTTQHDAIIRGLGAPVATDDEAPAIEAWSRAVDRLVDEASLRTVEELRRSARMIRDLLDAEGAARRFDERFTRRSFRFWTDEDGIRRASISFDDEGGAWVQAISDAALRPRRGGPRFVDHAEQKRAEELIADPRTNDQLMYDLMMDTLRAGALADHEQVFGVRQAGVRFVVVAAPNSPTEGEGVPDGTARPEGGLEDRVAVTYIEETGGAVPAWLAGQRACDTGTSECSIDSAGNPLYLGRESRLFSAKQKIALAIRDGGCRWRGCDRPPSYCEAHHIDPYVEGGCTDIDRGILLCRFHHMQLHHGGWRITRVGHHDFLLHPPGGGDAIPLPPRVPLVYAWAGIDPPPRRFRPAA